MQSKVNYSQAVVNLSYSNQINLVVQQDYHKPQILVLSGLNLRSYHFVKHLPNLLLFHADSCALKSFRLINDCGELPLQFLIARNNDFESFADFPYSDTLTQIDISQNPKLYEISDFNSRLRKLQKFYFGCISKNSIPTSVSKLNSLRLFHKLFIQQQLPQLQNVVFAKGCEAAIGNLLLKIDSDHKLSVFRTDNEPIYNHSALIQAFSIISGFEIVKLIATEYRVSRIAKSPVPLVSQRDTVPEFVQYPTEHVNERWLSEGLQKAREAQIKKGRNYIIFTVQLVGKIIIFANQLNGQEIDFEAEVARIDEDLYYQSNNNLENHQVQETQMSVQSNRIFDQFKREGYNIKNKNKIVNNSCSPNSKGLRKVEVKSINSNSIEPYELVGQSQVHSTIQIKPETGIQQISFFCTTLTHKQMIDDLKIQLLNYGVIIPENEISGLVAKMIHEIQFYNSKIEPIGDKFVVQIPLEFNKKKVLTNICFDLLCKTTDCQLTISPNQNQKYIAVNVVSGSVSYFLMGAKFITWEPQFSLSVYNDLLSIKAKLTCLVKEIVQGSQIDLVYSKIQYRFKINGEIVYKGNNNFIEATSQDIDGLYECEVKVIDNDETKIASLSMEPLYIRYNGSRPKKHKQKVQQVKKVDARSIKPKQQQPKLFEYYLPVYTQILQYSVDINRQYQILIKSPYTDQQPSLTIFGQLNVSNYNTKHQNAQFSGYIRSQAKCSVKKEENCKFLVNIDFCPSDTGKIMWLFLDYRDFNYMLPLTCSSIIDGAGLLSQTSYQDNVGFFDLFNGSVSLGRVKMDSSQFQIFNENKSQFQFNSAEVMPFSPTEYVRVDDKSTSLPTSDEKILQTILYYSFGSQFNMNRDPQLFASELKTFLSKRDKVDDDQAIFHDANCNLLVMAGGSVQLLSFIQEIDRNDALIKIQNLSGLLFDSKYVDKRIEQILCLQFDIDDDFPKLSYADLKGKLLDKITIPNLEKLRVGDQIELTISHPDPQYQQFLQQCSILICNPRNQAVRQQYFSGNKAVITPLRCDVGCRALLNLNGLTIKSGVIQGSAPNMKISQPINVNFTQNGKRLDCELSFKKGQMLLISNKLKGKYAASVQDCGSLLIGDRQILLGFGKGTIGVECESGAEAVQMINALTGRTESK